MVVELKKGSIVVVTTTTSKHRGQYGFINEVFKRSGRFGVMLEGNKRISYGKRGILPVPDNTDTRAKTHRDSHFNAQEAAPEVIPDIGVSSNTVFNENIKESPPVVENSSPNFQKAAGSDSVEISIMVREFALAIREIQRQMQLLSEKTEGGFKHMSDVIETINRRMSVLERVDSNSASPLTSNSSSSV